MPSIVHKIRGTEPDRDTVVEHYLDRDTLGNIAWYAKWVDAGGVDRKQAICCLLDDGRLCVKSISANVPGTMKSEASPGQIEVC